MAKNNFALAAHLFCTFLCRRFARLQSETSRNILVTRFMEEMSYVFLLIFFFHCRIFLTLVAANISYFPIIIVILFIYSALFNMLGDQKRKEISQKFSCCSSDKKCLFCLLSLALDLCRSFFLLSFVGLSPTISFSLSLSFSVFQNCGHDN